MSTAMTCPDAETMRQLAMGQLPAEEADAVRQHVLSCSACGQRLDALQASDVLVGDLRVAATVVRENDSTVQAVIERLVQLAPASKNPADSVTFSCAGCGKNLKVKAEFAGKKVKCPSCGQTTPVSAAPEPKKQSAGNDTQVESVDPGQTLNFLAPAQGPDELGRLSHYRILKKLGAGGMGMVFLGEDTMLHRKAAIKVMLPQFAASATSKERFLREARAAASIEHEHIVPIFQVGEDNGVPFLAMPFLKGEPLDVRIDREGKLPIAEALRIAREMAEGLAAAHANNLIHRDIKPGNVWLETRHPSSSGRAAGGEGGKVRLLDFGLARAQDDTTHLTQTGAVVGTPAFMAPEQARGGKIDARADLFSLGCVLYLMLTGQKPFEGPTVMSILTALAVETPTVPSFIDPEIPDSINDLTMRLLAKNAADRPASAEKVAEELAALQANMAPSAPQPAKSSRNANDTGAVPAKNKVEAAHRTAAPPRKRSLGLVAVVAVAVFGCLLTILAGGLIYRFGFQTENGTLLVEVDKDADVRFKNGKLEIRDPKTGKLLYTLAPSDKNKKLPPGDYLIDVVGADGLALSTKSFTLGKDGEKTVRVTLASAAIGPKGDTALAKSGETPAFAALDKLDPKAIPESERFPWQPKELVAVLGEHRGRHWSVVNQLAWSRDGKFVATGGPGGIALWDPRSLRPRVFVSGGGTFAISWDSKTIAVLSGDQSIRLWDLSGDEPKQRGIIKGLNEAYVPCLAFSPDGKTLAAACGAGKIRLWDVTGAKPKEHPALKGHTGAVLLVAFDPDGKTLASGGDDKTLRLWDLSGAEPKQKTVTPLKSAPCALAFSPDGKMLAHAGQGPGQGSDEDNWVHLWDVTAAEPKERAAIQGDAGAHFSTGPLTFSPDSKMLACVSGATQSVHFFDLSENKPKERATLKRGTGSFVAYAPDGKSLVTAIGGLLRMWDLTGDEPMERPEPAGHIAALGGALVSPDGKTMATFSTEAIRFWDMTGPAPRLKGERKQHLTWSASFSPDSKTLACSFATEVQLWDLAAAEPEIRTTFHPDKPNHPRQIAFSPDGKTLAVFVYLGADGKIGLWDVSGAEPQEKAVLLKSQAPFAIGPDGTRLVCGNTDIQNVWGPGSLQLWDLSGKEPKKASAPFGEPYGVLALSPDGKTVAYLNPATGIKSWGLDGPNPKERTIFEDPFDIHYQGSLAYAPDGKTLACTVGATVSLWDVKKAKRLKKWQLPGFVSKVSFAPDGRHLITANGNGTAYVLRLANPDGSPYIGADNPAALLPLDAERKAAEWLLKNGAALQLMRDGKQEDIQQGTEKLPAGKFTIFRISSAPGPVEMLVDHLRGLKDLRQIDVGTPLDDADFQRLTDLPNLQASLTDLHVRIAPDLTDRGLAHVAKLGKLGFFQADAPKLTEASTKVLCDMPLLSHWNSGPHMTDAGLTGLRGAKLRHVALSSKGITDEGMKIVSTWKDLVELRVQGPAVSDAGIPELKKLPLLSSLHVADAEKLTDKGLADIAQIKSLVTLDLDNVGVTNAGLSAVLKGLPALSHLSLGRSPFNDDSLAALAGSTTLSHLSLIGAPFSDAGLEHVKTIKNLKYLSLSGTRNTADGIAKLSAALPECTIHSDFGTFVAGKSDRAAAK